MCRLVIQHLALFVSTVLSVLAVGAQAQYLDPPINGEMYPYSLDTGRLDNATASPVTVWSTTISLDPSIPWLRVQFEAAKLAGESTVTITSLADGDSQTLNAYELSQWDFGSAYFNGPGVTIELVAGPHTVGNRLVISELFVGVEVIPTEAICGAVDNRAPTANAGGAVGRLLTSSLGGGCTGWITDLPNETVDKCHLSAGHCFVAGSGPFQVSQVIQFNVPNSNANCSIVHPPASKQFPIKSFTAVNGGIGNDWAVFEVNRNATTQKSTFQEQSAAIPLAITLPGTGNVTITGYGLDGGAGAGACSCTNPNGVRNQTQQADSGPITGTPGTQIDHQVDTCGANSGSPIQFNDQYAEAIGIHTHAGCATTSNHGTQITLPALQTAIQACESFNIDHTLVYDVENIPVSLPDVLLTDQFLTDLVTIIDLDLFATPVNKNGEGIIDPNAHQTWYQIEGEPADKLVLIANQFTDGEVEMTATDARYLVVPAAKGVCSAPGATAGQLCAIDSDCDDPPSQGNGICLFQPPQQNHFKCYDLAGPAVNESTHLIDQFGEQFVLVTYPRLLCNPVVKSVNQAIFPIFHPDDHLVCYEITPGPWPFEPNAIDQFKPLEPGYHLENLNQEWLCVPSTKIIAPGVPAASPPGWVVLAVLLPVTGLVWRMVWRPGARPTQA